MPGSDLRYGSIPACAGEPESFFNEIVSHPVYPRVCGGTIASLLDSKTVKGLSPRVRGNHLLRRRPGAFLGSIPACAGEPLADKILILIEL